jgi:effector-binding domain-containing protein
MKKIIIIVISILVVGIIGVIVVFGFFSAPDVSSYEFLTTPRIITMEDSLMLEVRVTGNPDEVFTDAFSLLFTAYYKIKDIPKGPGYTIPRLRCSVPVDKPVSSYSNSEYVSDLAWRIGLPVPPGTELPEVRGKEGVVMQLTTWEYGEVAEILHKGPYDKELPTIVAMETFVKNNGYEFTGIHEEEYLKGPGMLFVKPGDYYTIIRYPVKKQ